MDMHINRRASLAAAALSLSVCAAVVAADGGGAQQAAVAATASEQAGKMDALAQALAVVTSIRRVDDSILLSIPDTKLFTGADVDRLSHAGKMLLAKIGKELRTHDGNRVYIQQFVSDTRPTLAARHLALAQAHIIRSELVDHGVPPRRLVVDLEGGTPRAQAADAHHFELRITPEK